MIEEQMCGGYRIPDRFEKREMMLLLMALIVAMDSTPNRAMRTELIELEEKLFGASDSFIEEIEQLLTEK